MLPPMFIKNKYIVSRLAKLFFEVFHYVVGGSIRGVVGLGTLFIVEVVCGVGEGVHSGGLGFTVYGGFVGLGWLFGEVILYQSIYLLWHAQNTHFLLLTLPSRQAQSTLQEFQCSLQITFYLTLLLLALDQTFAMIFAVMQLVHAHIIVLIFCFFQFG